MDWKHRESKHTLVYTFENKILWERRNLFLKIIIEFNILVHQYLRIFLSVFLPKVLTFFYILFQKFGIQITLGNNILAQGNANSIINAVFNDEFNYIRFFPPIRDFVKHVCCFLRNSKKCLLNVFFVPYKIFKANKINNCNLLYNPNKKSVNFDYVCMGSSVLTTATESETSQFHKFY